MKTTWKAKALLLLLLSGVAVAGNNTVIIKMPAALDSARVSGVAGTRTAGYYYYGTYKASLLGHLFDVAVTGNYTLYRKASPYSGAWVAISDRGAFWIDGTDTKTKIWDRIGASGKFTSAALGDTSVTTASIKDDAINAAKIAANAVGTSEIIDGTVALADLATNSVDSNKIVGSSISSGDIAANAIRAEHIAAGAVGTSDIADGAVTLADLATNSVDSNKIVGNSISAGDIAVNAINGAHIAPNSIGSSEIVDGAIVSADIYDGTIVAADLGAGVATFTWDSLLVTRRIRVMNVGGTPGVIILPGGTGASANTSIGGGGTGLLLSTGYQNTLYGFGVGKNLNSYRCSLYGDSSGYNARAPYIIAFGGRTVMNATVGSLGAFGYRALEKITTGTHAFAFGQNAGRSNLISNDFGLFGMSVAEYATTLDRSNLFGGYVGNTADTLQDCNGIGYDALRLAKAITNTSFVGRGVFYSLYRGSYNLGGGTAAGYNSYSGSWNVFWGPQSFWTNTVGLRNIGLGFGSGYYETGSDHLYIDNRVRTNEATGRKRALVHGYMADSTYNQYLAVNGNLQSYTYNYGKDAGTTDSYVITLRNTINKLYNGMIVTFTPNTTNAGSSTLNVNGTGAKSIKNRYGDNTTSGFFKAKIPTIAIFDSTNQNWIVQAPDTVGGGSGTGGSGYKFDFAAYNSSPEDKLNAANVLDGLADEVEIQQWVDACDDSSGGKADFASGDYYIADQIEVNSHAIVFNGTSLSGRFNGTNFHGVNDNAIFWFHSDGVTSLTGLMGLGIWNMALHCDYTGFKTHAAIEAWNTSGHESVCDNIRVDNVWISGFIRSAYMRYCDSPNFTRTLSECGENLHFAKCNPVTLVNNVFSDSHYHGVILDSCYNVVITGNVFARAGNTAARDDDGEPALMMRNVNRGTVSGNIFWSNGTGIELTNHTQNVSLSGNVIRGFGDQADCGPAYVGIRIRDAFHTSISGGSISDIDTAMVFQNASAETLYTNVTGVKIDSVHRAFVLDDESRVNQFNDISYFTLRSDTLNVTANASNFFEADSKSLTFDNGASSDIATFPLGTTASEYDWAWTSDPGTPGACWVTAAKGQATLTCKAAVTGTPTWKITRKK